MPNLPTDNLYKFLAIFGLILICFATYYYQKWEEKLYFDFIDPAVELEGKIREKSRIEEIQYRSLKEIYDYKYGTKEELEEELEENQGYLSELVDGNKELKKLKDEDHYRELIEEAKEGLEIQKQIYKLQKELDSVKSENNMSFDHIPIYDDEETFSEEFESLEIQSEKLEGEIYMIYKKMDIAIESSEDVFIKCLALFVLGLILMLFGFGMWYYKFQIFIDAEQKVRGTQYLEMVKEINKKDVVKEMDDDAINEEVKV